MPIPDNAQPGDFVTYEDAFNPKTTFVILKADPDVQYDRFTIRHVDSLQSSVTDGRQHGWKPLVAVDTPTGNRTVEVYLPLCVPITLAYDGTVVEIDLDKAVIDGSIEFNDGDDQWDPQIEEWSKTTADVWTQTANAFRDALQANAANTALDEIAAAVKIGNGEDWHEALSRVEEIIHRTGRGGAR